MAARYKPAVAAWVTTERKRKGWKPEELSRRLLELGLDAQPGTVRVWEAPSGRPPRRETIEAMEMLFGSKAPVEPEADPTSIVDAIDRLREAVETQTKALLAREKERDAWLTGLITGLVEQAQGRASDPTHTPRGVSGP